MSEKQFIPGLTIKDRLNFPYLLARQIIVFQDSILSTENSESEIQEAINGLVEMIPEVWKDEEWFKEITEAETITQVDVRPLVTGSTRMSEQACQELGIPAFIEEKSVDSNKMFHCVIDLLQRRGLLSRQTYTEKIPSKELDEIVQVDP